jgi:glycosyltransferase involved in cell wall biosynthesis
MPREPTLTMRVGLVVPGFSADADDWCIPALRHLARALARHDDVRVIATRYPYRAARYRVDGADVLAIGGAARRGAGTLDVWRRTLDVLRTEHRRRAFDVLHAFWATESGLLTAMAGRLLRIPTVVSLAGGELVALPEIGYGDQRVAWERLKVRASLRLASAVTAGSDQLLTLAARQVPPARLHRAPLGVDLDLFNPGPPHTLLASGGAASSAAAGSGANARASSSSAAAGSGANALASSSATAGSGANARPPRLVHVATLTPVKDQATLLRALSILRQRVPGVTLDIVGGGPLRPDLERLATALGVAQAVYFRGDVDHAALPEVYRAGSAFVLSSRHEAQGMVAIEAAVCGLPIVGTRVGVIPELAASAEAVVPIGAASALADGLFAALTTHAESSSSRSDELPARARREFGLEPCVARFRALYADVTAT